MMNAVALFLVFSSLVTAGLWSPTPEKQPNPAEDEDDVIVKNGHQKLVVEFDKENGNTKVSISPQEDHKPPVLLHDISYISTEKYKLSTPTKEAVDALKETVSEKAQQVKEAIRDVTHKVQEKASDATQKAKQMVTEKSEKVEEGAKEMAAKAKEGAKTVIDTSNTIGKGVEKGVSTTIESGKEKAKEKAKQGGETAEHFVEQATGTANRVKEEGEKDLNEILRRGREVGYDVLVYVVSPRAVEPAIGVVQLLGFAAAYGMCLWVTFVSSYVLAGALNRQQFGVVQSKIYPVYFRTMAYSVALALFAHLLRHRKRMSANRMAVEVFVGYNLLASLLMILFNLLYLEPRATKVMFQRMKVEKEEGRGSDGSISESSSKAAADPIPDSAAPPVTGADSPATPITGADATSASPVMPEKLELAAARSQIVELSERMKKLNEYSSFLNIVTLMHLTLHLVYLGQHLHVAC